MRTKRRQFFSLRRHLVKIHRDLFTISDFVERYEDEYVLSRFEMLVLILEDRRFFNHGGFDMKATLREFLKKCAFMRHGGASTIDMQFVRTATGFRKKTVSRKLYEMFLSFLIQYRYSKFQILRSYLAAAYFGSGITGANAACRRTFNMPLNEISDQQAAELASMLVYPRPKLPTPSWKARIDRRASYGLIKLRKLEKKFDKLPKRG